TKRSAGPGSWACSEGGSSRAARASPRTTSTRNRPGPVPHEHGRPVRDHQRGDEDTLVGDVLVAGDAAAHPDQDPEREERADLPPVSPHRALRGAHEALPRRLLERRLEEGQLML